MKIITKYISKTVLEVFCVLFLIFCSLLFIVSLVRELANIGHNNYQLLQAIVYVFLQLPSKLLDIMPLITMLSGVVGLGIFASNSELIIFRTSGFSTWRICQKIVVVAIVIALFTLFIQEFIAPGANAYSEQYKLNLKSGGSVLHTKNGIWTRSGDNFIYIDSIADKRMSNVSNYLIKNNKLEQIQHAKYVIAASTGWHAYEVETLKLSDNHVIAENKSHAFWDLTIPLKFVLIDTDDPSNLTMQELANYVFKYKHEVKGIDKYTWVFWDRISLPLKVIVMMLLAVPIIFGPMRSASLGLRIIFSSIFGISYYFLSMLAGPASILLQVSPVLAVFLPLFIFLLIALLGLRRYG